MILPLKRVLFKMIGTLAVLGAHVLFIVLHTWKEDSSMKQYGRFLFLIRRSNYSGGYDF